jgi:hypothetical protein
LKNIRADSASSVSAVGFAGSWDGWEPAKVPEDHQGKPAE